MSQYILRHKQELINKKNKKVKKKRNGERKQGFPDYVF